MHVWAAGGGFGRSTAPACVLPNTNVDGDKAGAARLLSGSSWTHDANGFLTIANPNLGAILLIGDANRMAATAFHASRPRRGTEQGGSLRPASPEFRRSRDRLTAAGLFISPLPDRRQRSQNAALNNPAGEVTGKSFFAFNPFSGAVSCVLSAASRCLVRRMKLAEN